jgi:hypothetical protein
MLRAAERGVLNVAPGSMAQSHWPQKSMNRQISRLCGTVGDSASVDSLAYVESIGPCVKLDTPKSMLVDILTNEEKFR